MPYASRTAARGVVLTIIDITSRRAAESEARRLSAIVRTARDAIISHSLEGQDFVVERRRGAPVRLHGAGSRRQPCCGSSCRTTWPHENTERIVEETEAGHDVPPFETTRIAKDGTRGDVLLSVAPVRSEKGEISGASVIAIDITARKHAEERAATAIEQREKFLALLSHELRNPLMAIASANEVLMRSK